MRYVKSFILLLLSTALIVGLVFETKFREDYAIIFTKTSIESVPKTDVVAVLQASAAIGNHMDNVKIDAVPDGISEVENLVKTNALESKTASGQAVMEIGKMSSTEMEKAVLQKPDTALARLVSETILNVKSLISKLNEE